ncbi:hypothetical protein, partial [Pseudoalteromonas marina]|uniref:hypothetical protein n=1 Tax=Pseudoalteromonas marina TaxID=267375 RepID=UPI003C4D3120
MDDLVLTLKAGAAALLTVAVVAATASTVKAEIREAAEDAVAHERHFGAQPMLAGPVSEKAAPMTLSTTPQRVNCGSPMGFKTWKCIDPAGGGVTVYRGGDDVSTTLGFPESADTEFGGDSREAWLVL